ncbi:MAG: 1-(5-phosphoribosyl)-5-[(5-phosphoribosylamino)methylideneamino]imidazole-4-carboxamide isomerase [Acholeplasmataceae bacterium]
MTIYPAIDLINGASVRLEQGDFGRTTVFDSDPIARAQAFFSEGATFLHVVDLDAARTGQLQNRKLIEAIKRKVPIKIQVGGGLRDRERIEAMLETGVDRVIVGTYATRMFPELIELNRSYPERIVVSIDSKNGYVTDHGWQQVSRIRTLDLCERLDQHGIERVIMTDIARDGMMAGPNLELYREVKEKTGLKIIASGGISSPEDIEELARLKLDGAIIGRALYEGKIRLKEVISCFQDA